MEFMATLQTIALLVVILLATLYILRKLFFDEGKVDNFHDKFVLITGCDSGFGKMAALQLDQMGFRVLATCLTSDGEKALAEEGSEHMTTFRLDVTKSEQVQEVYNKVKTVIPSGKGLWSIVNNAGITQVGPIDWIPLEKFKSTADVNLWGLIDVTKTFLPLVKKAKGRVVNLTSMGGRVSVPNLGAYCVPKYGAEAFSDALRLEMSVFGIQVSIIEPGYYVTAMTKALPKIWANLWNSLEKEKQDEYGDECYKTYTKMSKDVVDHFASPHLYEVVDCILHAVTSNRPKSRYAIGWDTRKYWLWVSWLPTSIGDAIVNSLCKLPVPKSLQK